MTTCNIQSPNWEKTAGAWKLPLPGSPLEYLLTTKRRVWRCPPHSPILQNLQYSVSLLTTISWSLKVPPVPRLTRLRQLDRLRKALPLSPTLLTTRPPPDVCRRFKHVRILRHIQFWKHQQIQTKKYIQEQNTSPNKNTEPHLNDTTWHLQTLSLIQVMSVQAVIRNTFLQLPITKRLHTVKLQY